ncbi:hypothetical protein ACPWT1_04225 [Ramlibacter sp. MMS24-I3-19]|uniref:hypothetical protein n=1 Tax=Ramlibacter sp. MMS24-I3-19 TaxID=3416606 RepID=UPI003D03833E
MRTSNKNVRFGNWGRALRAGLLCVPALALVACGGGGGGGSAGTPVATPTTTTSGGSGSTAVGAVVITSSNAQAVAAEALAASTNTDATAGSAFVTGVQVSGGSGPRPMLLTKAARSLVTKPSVGPLATGVATTQACTAGGSITEDMTVSGTNGLTAGDAFTFTANNCTESIDSTTTVVMNGTMSITIVSGTYDPAATTYPKSITMRIVSTNFSMKTGSETETFNGDLTMSLTEESATSSSVTVSSSSLSSTVGSHSVTLTNYSVKETESPTGSTLAVSGTVQTSNGRFASSEVTYTITTPTPLAVSSTGSVTAGAIQVTGSGSALLLTVTSTDTFSLQVDTNGDGTYDSTSTVTRAQLDSQL